MEKFLNKLAEDEQLRSNFLAQTTPEGAYKVAKPYIGSMSMEEFAKQMVGLANTMTKVENGELSADDLDSVAGGSGEIAGMANSIGALAGMFGGEKGAAIGSFISGLGQTAEAGKGIFEMFKSGKEGGAQ